MDGTTGQVEPLGGGMSEDQRSAEADQARQVTSHQSKTFFDLYLDYATEQTDAPIVYHQAMVYLIVSCMVSKNIYLPFGYKNLYPNLYILIVGPSSLHRKSWCQGMAVNLIKKVHPDYEIMECSSRESFIAEFASEDRSPSSCGLIEIDELKGFMDRTKSKHHMDGFLQDLSSAYDGNSLKRRSGVSKEKAEVFKIDTPFLNITAACSFDWLSQSIESSDVTGGFFSRFLWIIHNDKVMNPQSKPGKPDFLKQDVLISKMRNMQQMIGVAVYSKEAEARWDEWYREFMENHQGGFWDAQFNRLTVITQKISMLNAIMRLESNGEATVDSVEVKLCDIEAAIMFCEGTIKQLGEIAIGSNPLEVITKRVLNFIVKHKEVSHRKVLQSIRGLDADLCAKVIRTLKEGEYITVEQNEKGGNVYKVYR